MLGPQGKNTTGDRNYLIADIEGKGHYVGVNYYVDCPSPMWGTGEGDDMFFIDGERWPSSLHGTGTRTTSTPRGRRTCSSSIPTSATRA